jgi:hypothetical protein
MVYVSFGFKVTLRVVEALLAVSARAADSLTRRTCRVFQHARGIVRNPRFHPVDYIIRTKGFLVVRAGNCTARYLPLDSQRTGKRPRNEVSWDGHCLGILRSKYCKRSSIQYESAIKTRTVWRRTFGLGHFRNIPRYRRMRIRGLCGGRRSVRIRTCSLVQECRPRNYVSVASGSRPFQTRIRAQHSTAWT